MYFELVKQCVQGLKNLEGWIDKAEKYAEAKHFDVAVLLQARLAPDQHPFVYQVQSACDYVKAAAAWLSGQTPPKHPDTEKTLAEVRGRIQKTIAFAEAVREPDYAGAAQRKVSVSWVPGKVIFGTDYIVQVTIPNVYFHLVTAYSLLRHNGVVVGKMDFLGPMNFVEG